MTTPQLLEYVGAQLKTGASRDAITKALIGQGWTQEDVNEAFALMPKPQPAAPAAAPAISMPIQAASSPVMPASSMSGGSMSGGGMPMSSPMASPMQQQPRQFTPPLQQPSQFIPPMQQPSAAPQQPSATFRQSPSFPQSSGFQQSQSPIPRQFTASPTAAPMMTMPNEAQRRALMGQHAKKPSSHVFTSFIILILGILIGAAGMFAYYSFFR